MRSISIPSQICPPPPPRDRPQKQLTRNDSAVSIHSGRLHMPYRPALLLNQAESSGDPPRVERSARRESFGRRLRSSLSKKMVECLPPTSARGAFIRNEGSRAPIQIDVSLSAVPRRLVARCSAAIGSKPES